MTTTILLLIIVILFSALFSGMEIAFVSSNRLLMGIDLNSRTLTSFVIDKEEKKAVIKFTVEKVKKRIPVIAGTGSNSTPTATILYPACL